MKLSEMKHDEVMTHLGRQLAYYGVDKLRVKVLADQNYNILLVAYRNEKCVGQILVDAEDTYEATAEALVKHFEAEKRMGVTQP